MAGGTKTLPAAALTGPSNHTSVAVPITEGGIELRAAVANPKYLLIQVIGANDVYVRTDGTAPLNDGSDGAILLKGDAGSGGGSFSPVGYVPTGQILARAVTGAAVVSVVTA